MAEKRYTAIFDAQDHISGTLKRMTDATKRANQAQGQWVAATKRSEDAQMRMKRSSDEASRGIERMKRAMTTAGTGMAEFGRNGMSAMKGLGSAIGGIWSRLTSLPSLIMGAASAWGLFKAGELVVGGAMQKELTQMQMGALLADKGKGKELFGMVQDKAMTSMFSEKDFASAATTFLPVTKNFEELSRMMDINERLAASNPLEGMEGASFSMREALSGDIASIADRFNISKGLLRESGFDSSASWQQNLEAVDRTLDKMGYTAKYVDDVNNSAYAQWEQFKSNSLKLFADTGEGILKKLKSPLKDLNTTLGSEKMTAFVDRMSGGLAEMFERSLKYVENMNVSWADVEKWSKETWGGAKDLMRSAWGVGKELVDLIAGEDDASLTSAFINLGKSMDGIAKTLDAIAAAFDAIGKVGSWFADGLSGKSLMKAWTGNDTWQPEKKNEYGPFLKQFAPLADMPELWDGVKKSAGNFFGFDPMTERHGRLRGSHMGGLSYVPTDGYVAKLHQGERVLTAEQNRAYSKGSGAQVMVTGNTFHVRKESDIDAIGEAIVQRLVMR